MLETSKMPYHPRTVEEDASERTGDLSQADLGTTETETETETDQEHRGKMKTD